MRKVVEEEGREARNLLNWNVPLDEKGAAEAKISKKPPTSPRPQSASPKPPRHLTMVDSEPCSNCHTSKRASFLFNSKNRVRSASAGRTPQKELRARYWAFLFENVRARYWAFLFENLHRAVDEIYQTCETDESVVECKEAIMMLENYTKDFHALIQWLHLSKNFENTPPPDRPTSLAWEVRKSLPGKNLLRDVFLDKCLASCSSTRKVLDFGSSSNPELTVTSSSENGRQKTSSEEPCLHKENEISVNGDQMMTSSSEDTNKESTELIPCLPNENSCQNETVYADMKQKVEFEVPETNNIDNSNSTFFDGDSSQQALEQVKVPINDEKEEKTCDTPNQTDKEIASNFIDLPNSEFSSKKQTAVQTDEEQREMLQSNKETLTEISSEDCSKIQSSDDKSCSLSEETTQVHIDEKHDCTSEVSKHLTESTSSCGSVNIPSGEDFSKEKTLAQVSKMEEPQSAAHNKLLTTNCISVNAPDNEVTVKHPSANNNSSQKNSHDKKIVHKSEHNSTIPKVPEKKNTEIVPNVIDITMSSEDPFKNKADSVMDISFMSPPNALLSNTQQVPPGNTTTKLSSVNPVKVPPTSTTVSSTKPGNVQSSSVHKVVRSAGQIHPRGAAVGDNKKTTHTSYVPSKRYAAVSSPNCQVFKTPSASDFSKTPPVKAVVTSSNVASKAPLISHNSAAKMFTKDVKTGSSSSLSSISIGRSWADKVKGSTSEPNLKVEDAEENKGGDDDSEGWETVRGRTRSRNSPAKKLPQKVNKNSSSTVNGKVSKLSTFTSANATPALQRNHTFHGTPMSTPLKKGPQDKFEYSDKLRSKEMGNYQKVRSKFSVAVNRSNFSKIDPMIKNDGNKSKFRQCEKYSPSVHSDNSNSCEKNNAASLEVSTNSTRKANFGSTENKVNQHGTSTKREPLPQRQQEIKNGRNKDRAKRQFSLPPESNKVTNDDRMQKEKSLPPMKINEPLIKNRGILQCNGIKDQKSDTSNNKAIKLSAIEEHDSDKANDATKKNCEAKYPVPLEDIKEAKEEQNSLLNGGCKNLQNRKKRSIPSKNLNIVGPPKSAKREVTNVKGQKRQSLSSKVTDESIVKHKNAINVSKNSGQKRILKCSETTGAIEIEPGSKVENVPSITDNCPLPDEELGVLNAESSDNLMLLKTEEMTLQEMYKELLLQESISMKGQSGTLKDKIMCDFAESELLGSEESSKEENSSDNEKINEEFTISSLELDESDATLADDQEISSFHEDGLPDSQTLEWYDSALREEAQERVHQLGLSWGDQMDRLDLELRTPGRALQMHEKLSSPFRKRSLSETLRRQKEKQIKAQEQRERLLEEKAQKFKDIAKKVEEMKAWKEEKQQRQRIIMEQKLQRAQEKRKMQLQMIVRKAHDEEEKVNEIAFINSLEAQNKRHDLISKEKDHEARLQDIQEERQRKLEEKAAKEAAAEERRRVLEAERQARLLEMQKKRKLRDLKIEQQLMEKEKERQELANQKARDRELRLSALNAAQQATLEELQKKIQQKQEESARRHEENMEQIRQKAFELSVRRYSSNNDDAPRLVPYETIKMCTLCNVLIGSEVYLLSHLRGKKHQEAVKDQHQGQDPSTEELESYNLKHIVDAPADKLNPDIALDKERQKALKKRCKKLRQRMTNRGLEYETALGKKIEKADYEHKQKMQRIIKDIGKHLAGQGTGPWDINLVSSIERCLGELERLLEKCIPSGKVAFRIVGGISVLMEILCSILNGSKETETVIPNRTLVRACFVCSLACRGCYDNCHMLLFSNKLGVILDLLIHRLGILIPDNYSQPLSSTTGCVAVALSVDNVARSLMQLLAVILTCLSTREPGFTGIKHMVIEQTNPAGQNEEFQQRVHDVISYTVSIGIVDKLSQYLNNVRGPIDTEPEVADFLLNGMDFLTSLTKLFSDSYELVFDRKKADDTTQLVATFKLTELVGTVSLLYSTLLHSGAPSRGDDPPPQLVDHTVNVAVSVLKLLNQMAVMDLQMMQSVLSNEGLSLLLRHIASYFLWYCSHWDCQDLLHEVILLVGCFTVLSPDNQVVIQSGQRPTVLQQLCSLPFQYFSDPPLCNILFPTLIACCHNNPHNKTILEQEMSPELLSNYIEAHLLDIHQTALFPSRTKKGGEARWLLATRFPKDHWTAAKQFFSTES